MELPMVCQLPLVRHTRTWQLGELLKENHPPPLRPSEVVTWAENVLTAPPSTGEGQPRGLEPSPLEALEAVQKQPQSRTLHWLPWELHVDRAVPMVGGQANQPQPAVHVEKLWASGEHVPRGCWPADDTRWLWRVWCLASCREGTTCQTWIELLCLWWAFPGHRNMPPTWTQRHQHNTEQTYLWG